MAGHTVAVLGGGVGGIVAANELRRRLVTGPQEDPDELGARYRRLADVRGARGAA